MLKIYLNGGVVAEDRRGSWCCRTGRQRAQGRRRRSVQWAQGRRRQSVQWAPGRGSGRRERGRWRGGEAASSGGGEPAGARGRGLGGSGAGGGSSGGDAMESQWARGGTVERRAVGGPASMWGGDAVESWRRAACEKNDTIVSGPV
jgi:hypothetical protein